MRILLAFVLMCGVAAAGEIKVVPSSQKTSRDIGLDFVCESVALDFEGDVALKGTVTNTGDSDYWGVMVVFTVKDRDGGFINRDNTLAEPDEIGVGEVGYIDTFVRMEGKSPAVVEYSVTGRRQ